MSGKDPETMTDAEIAERQYNAHDAGELSDDEGEPVEFEVTKPLLSTISFRVPRDEADAIRAAAHEADISQSEWIRAAARIAINDKLVQPTLPSVTAGKLQAIKDLVDAVLTDTRTPGGGASTFLVQVKSGGAGGESAEDSMAELLAALERSVATATSSQAASTGHSERSSRVS